MAVDVNLRHSRRSSARRRAGAPAAWAAYASFLFLALTTEPTSAQTSSQAKAAAEAQFDEGLSLMKSGKLAEACSKLESSQRIEPAVGTLLYLGECYTRVGRTASAWATFREAASVATAANQPERAKVGKKRAEELEPNLAYVKLVVPESVLGLPGLTILRNGEVLEPSLVGTQIPVDPGPLRVEVRASGYQPFVTTAEVAQASRTSVDVPNLRPVAAGGGNQGPESAQKAGGAPVQPILSAGPKRFELTGSEAGNGQRTLGLVIGGVGLVGLGVGTYFGLSAMSKNSDAEASSCNDSICQKASDLDKVDAARRNATISNVAFGLGTVALGTGALLYLLAPKARHSGWLAHPRIAKHEVMFAIEGRL